MKKKASLFGIILSVIILFFSWIYHRYRFLQKSPEKLSPVLNVYNWEDYFGQNTIKDFEKKFGVKVNLEYFEDDEEMISSIQSNPGKYDVITADDNIVKTLTKSWLLAPINLKNIPNLENIDRKFLNPNYDPYNKYSIPYVWGSMGIAYNTKFIKENVESWNILWNPVYKGKISMLVNPYDVLCAALKSLGYSVNTNDSSQLEEAKKKLMEQRSLLRNGYEYTLTIRDDLISEKLWIGYLYNGDGAYARSKNSNIRFIVPWEGTRIWIDNLCIPRDAPHKYTAEVFINYVLEAKVSADIANYIHFADCNKSAEPYISKEILTDPAIYPSEEILKNCEFYMNIGTPEEIALREQTINRIWSELQPLEKKR